MSAARELSDLVRLLCERPAQRISYYQGSKVVTKAGPEVYADIEACKQRLVSWGLRPSARVGIMADNCYEWMVYDLALMDLRCVSVCLPPAELAKQSADELAERYALSLLVTSREYAPGAGADARSWLVVIGGEAVASVALRPGGERNDVPGAGGPALGEDVLTLVFSSGTSGKLKCLVISRSGTESLIEGFGRLYAFRTDDAILAFLPFSTFQQRWMVYTALWYGFDLQLADPVSVFRAFKELSPTIFAAPPLFYETIEKRFYAQPLWKRRLLAACARVVSAVPLARLRARLQRRLFRPFHTALGGRTRLMLTGGAPTAPSTFALFGWLGFPLYEGYGLTETGYVAINLPGRQRAGSVGREVIPGSVSIAEDGEILVSLKRPLCLGYLFVEAAEQEKTFRPDGAIASGDIGSVDADGFLTLRGRKKEIIITQGGYKLHPESLEQKLEASPDVARAVVFGGGELPIVTALIGVHHDSPAVRGRVESIVATLNEELPRAASLGRVVFATEAFSVESGFLNRSLKLDRKRIYAHFRDRLIGVSP